MIGMSPSQRIVTVFLTLLYLVKSLVLYHSGVRKDGARAVGISVDNHALLDVVKFIICGRLNTIATRSKLEVSSYDPSKQMIGLFSELLLIYRYTTNFTPSVTAADDRTDCSQRIALSIGRRKKVS